MSKLRLSITMSLDGYVVERHVRWSRTAVETTLSVVI